MPSRRSRAGPTSASPAPSCSPSAPGGRSPTSAPMPPRALTCRRRRGRRLPRARPRLRRSDDRPRAGPARRAPGAPGAQRRGGHQDLRRAVQHPRAHREDRRARARRRPADDARRRGAQRAAPRRAAPRPAARGRPRAGPRRGRRRLPRAQPDGMTARGDSHGESGAPSESRRAGADVIALTAPRAAAAVQSGEPDRRELFAAYRERAAADDLNAYLGVADEGGWEGVGGGPLSGVPLAVKDLFCTEGVPSQAGSRILEGYRPPYTATVVRRLAQAGAPLLGKTNQDEFAMGSSNENSAYGPALNPWDRTRVPGGSSGGSAAAGAAGGAPWALGTDTGGSIRQPAALCGIVGLKPTYGAVSRFGMIAFASSLDQAGPLTRDVTDAALLFRHMVGHDERDATSVAFPEEVRLPSAQSLEGVRLGVPEELSGEGIEPGILERFHETLELARSLGASVETTRLPHAPHALAAYYLIAPAEC